jgi:hypothetical protein
VKQIPRRIIIDTDTGDVFDGENNKIGFTTSIRNVFEQDTRMMGNDLVVSNVARYADIDMKINLRP